MENEYIEDSVRTRLILAGINELQDHGVKDFSLRRAALGAQVSCAAPYRHFKDKDEFIFEIIRYISSRWHLLYREISGIYKNDTVRLVIEASVALLRFWIANPNFRSVLMLSQMEKESALEYFDSEILLLVDSLCDDEKKARIKKYTVRTLIYGTLMLIGCGALENSPETISVFRQKVENEISEMH